MVQQGAGVPYVALLIILAFVGEETGSEGGDLAGVQREGPSPESLKSVPLPLHAAWGGGLALSPWVRGTREPGSVAPGALLRHQLSQSPGTSIPSRLPLSACPAPSPSPQVGSPCWQGRESGCLCLVEVGLCLLGQLAVGV